MRDIFVIIQIIGQNELAELRQRGRNNFRGWLLPAQQLIAEFAEFEVRFSRDNIIHQLYDLLLFGLITDFWPAQNDLDLRSDPLQNGNNFSRLGDIPNINAEPNDLRRHRQERFGDFDGSLVDVEFAKRGAGTQRAHVGQQIPQAKGGMNVFGIQRGEDDFGHRSSPARQRAHAR